MSPVELPYSYRDVDGDRLAVFTGEIPGQGRGVNLRTDSHGCSIPAEDVPALVRAILAAAGDTGHVLVSREEIDEHFAAGRQIGAQIMRDRAMRAASDAPGTPYTPAEAIRALSLPFDGDTTPEASLDSQLPDRGGDIITDLDVALATRTDLTDEHRAFYEAVLCRVEAIRAERDRALHAARSMRERAAAKIEYWGSGLTGSQVSAAIRALPLIPDGDTTDAEAWDAAYDQGHADGLRMGDARAVDVESRLAALEKLTSDQSDALEAQSRLIDSLRADMRSAQAAIRGLGEALQGRIQVQVDPLKGRSADEWFEFGKRLRRDMGENE